METRAHYVAVGAFVLALVFLAFTAVLWLAGTQFAVSYDHYDIFFKGPVTGLSKGAAVDYNGIRVGQVSEIEIDPNNVEQIRVTVEIKSTVVIKEDAAANVETNILSGVSYVLITRGTQEAKKLVAHDGQRYPVIRPRRSTLASISARGPQLLEKLDDILDQVEDLLNDHNREVFASTLEHVEKFTGSLSAHSDDIGQLVAEGKTALASLDKLTTDVDNSYTAPDGLKEQLSGTLKGLSAASHQLDLALQDARPGVRTFSQHTLVDIGSLIGETRQFIAGLSRLAAQLERDPTRLLFGDRREGYQPK
ncbi:MAG TPA: MlaD family protein [Stellaceae bacterium]|nr:MlaD family protein [Stellaceae bacterium]